MAKEWKPTAWSNPFSFIGWIYDPEENTTRCKHREGPCETCGTTNQRDVPHRTRGGLGAVGRALRGKKRA